MRLKAPRFHRTADSRFPWIAGSRLGRARGSRFHWAARSRISGLTIQLSKSHHARARRAACRLGLQKSRKRVRITLAGLIEAVCRSKVQRKYRWPMRAVREVAAQELTAGACPRTRKKTGSTFRAFVRPVSQRRKPASRSRFDSHPVKRAVHEEERNQEKHQSQDVRQHRVLGCEIDRQRYRQQTE